MKVYVVDNGGQWTHREHRTLKYLKVETKIISNNTEFEELDVDGLVLSGGAGRISNNVSLGKTSEYFKKANFPILAICVAHQFMANFFGGKSGIAKIPEFGKAELIIDEENDLFKKLPKKFFVWESHNDEVKKISKELTLLAHSANCKFQAIKHLKKSFYGVQFHPEVEETEYGVEIFKNFLKVCKK